MSVIKNYLYNVSYQLLVIIIPLITVPYISGILGEEGVGKYAYTTANTQYFIIFGMIGIALYANRQIAYIRDNKEKTKSTFYSIYSLQLITVTISFILFLIFALVLNNGEYKIMYIAQSLNILAAMFDISWLFIGLEQFKRIVIRNTIIKLISLLSIFIFVKSSQDVTKYILIIGLSALIGNLSFWLYIPKMIGIGNIKICDRFIHFRGALALFIPQIAIQVYLLLDRTLLGLITNVEQVGYYENSQKLVKIGLTLATAVGTVMMPKISNTISKGQINKVKYYLKNAFLFVSMISFAVAFGLVGIIENLVPWFFKGRFLGIEKLIIFSTVIIIAISWSNILGMLLISMKKNKQYTISVTVGAITNFSLNILILRSFGSLGACITTVIAECVVTAIQFYCIRDIINPLKLIKPTIILLFPSTVMFLGVKFIGKFMDSNLITTMLQVLMGGIIYIIIVLIIIRIKYKKDLFSFIKGFSKIDEDNIKDY